MFWRRAGLSTIVYRNVNKNMVLEQKLASKWWNFAYRDANPQGKKHNTRPVIHNNSYNDSKYNQ